MRKVTKHILSSLAMSWQLLTYYYSKEDMHFKRTLLAKLITTSFICLYWCEICVKYVCITS